MGQVHMKVQGQGHRRNGSVIIIIIIIIIIVIIIIIINEETIVAFSPKTTRTRYKVKKNKTARYVVSSNMEKQLVTDTTTQTIVF